MLKYAVFRRLVAGILSTIMNYCDLVRPCVLTQPVYEPGKPIEDVAREFGLDPEAILKLASNENPLGPSPLGKTAAIEALADANLYPDGGALALKAKLAEHWGLAPNQFLVGNGSNELLVMLAQAFCQPGDEAVMGEQAFIAFKLAVLLSEGKAVEVPMPDLRHDLDALLAAVTPKTRFLYLANPNNPTGDDHPQAAIEKLITALPPHVIVVYDEAYAEYLDNPVDLRPLIAAGHKIICLRTFSKIYGLSALRIGYAYGDAEAIAFLERVRQPFNANAIAQAAAIAALTDTAFVAEGRAVNNAGQTYLKAGLEALGLTVTPSRANFLLVEVEDGVEVFRLLQEVGIIVRPLKGYRLPRHVRITVGTASQNDQLLATLDRLLADPTTAAAIRAQTTHS